MAIFNHGQALTEAEREQLLADRAALEAWLEPASTEQVGALLVTPMLAVRVAKGEGAFGDMVTAEYAEALDGLPAMALNAARRALNRDEIPGIDPKFMPTPTELARVVKDFAAKAEFERYWIDYVMTLGEADADPPESPEMKARVGELVADFAAELTRSAAQRDLDELERKAKQTRQAIERNERVAADLATRKPNSESAAA